ncbi:MAG TPA: hypothetical protein V6D25_12120 [Leptolyngbyaceae cyanobacterium]
MIHTWIETFLNLVLSLCTIETQVGRTVAVIVDIDQVVYIVVLC